MGATAFAPTTQAQVIEAIEAYVRSWGGDYSQWYVGIAANPSVRLFRDHCVNEKGVWIWRGCVHTDEARAIEAYFMWLGMKGGGGGGDGTTKAVYAYLITNQTRE